MTSKPDPESPYALLTETERGLSCDVCFSHKHDENAHALEAQSDSIKDGVKAIFEKTREAYLIKHQIHVGLKTSHQYFNVVRLSLSLSLPLPLGCNGHVIMPP